MNKRPSVNLPVIKGYKWEIYNKSANYWLVLIKSNLAIKWSDTLLVPTGGYCHSLEFFNYNKNKPYVVSEINAQILDAARVLSSEFEKDQHLIAMEKKLVGTITEVTYED